MLDPYLIPNTDILQNRLGITDKSLLEKAESDITYLKLLDIDAWLKIKHLHMKHSLLFTTIFLVICTNGLGK